MIKLSSKAQAILEKLKEGQIIRVYPAKAKDRSYIAYLDDKRVNIRTVRMLIERSYIELKEEKVALDGKSEKIYGLCKGEQ